MSRACSARSASCGSRCRCRRPRSAWSCAKPSAATACTTASSTCRSRAAWRAAITPSRRPERGRASSSPPAISTWPRNERAAAEGVAVITVPDNRWERVDIKSISLLPNVLAKQAAREQGAEEAWFVDRDGKVTEGSSSNAWIVTMGGKVVTRAADKGILRGITRTVLLDVIEAQGLDSGGAPVHGRGGLRRPRSLSDVGQPDRPAGGAHRRAAGRQRRAGKRRDRAPEGFPPPRGAKLNHRYFEPQGGFAPNLCLHGPRPCLVMATSGSCESG